MQVGYVAVFLADGIIAVASFTVIRYQWGRLKTRIADLQARLTEADKQRVTAHALKLCPGCGNEFVSWLLCTEHGFCEMCHYNGRHA